MSSINLNAGVSMPQSLNQSSKVMTNNLNQKCTPSFGSNPELSKLTSKVATNTGKAIVALSGAGLVSAGSNLLAKTTGVENPNVSDGTEIPTIHKYSAEVSSNSTVGTLNHQTHFFREPETDEIVQNYIVDRFGSDDEINVVSGACSSGEEAKSYAMMIDLPKDKLHVSGFDISDNSVEEAKKDTVQLITGENGDESFLADNYYEHEIFLTDDNFQDITPYLKKCRERFENSFEKVGDTFKMPTTAADSMNQAIESYEELFKLNPTEKEKLSEKFEFLKHLQKESLKSYYIVQNYKAREGSFDNVTFERGDVLNLEKLYRPNSVNVLLYRNALYHSIASGDAMTRVLLPNAFDIMDSIAKQMNKVTKKDGLVVFEEGMDDRCGDGSEDLVAKIMESNGFVKYVHNGVEKDNIWVKVEDIG